MDTDFGDIRAYLPHEEDNEMKCLNCGQETNLYLCENCQTAPILDKVFTEIRYYKPDTCTNLFLSEYVSTLTEKENRRDCIPEILGYFDFEISEYYYCQYYKMRGDSRFENAAESYLAKHPWDEVKSQRTIYSLLSSYVREDFVKPRRWCDWINTADNLYCELYAQAAQYYGMVGEYDAADAVTDKALEYCSDPAYTLFISCSRENMLARLEKQREDTLRYRTKKPYWPATEERRRMIAKIYDEKGINYSQTTSKSAKKSTKIPENEFKPVLECFDQPENYCAFWCAEAFSVAAVKAIYQIAAVKVVDGKITDSFQSYVRPWDNSASRKAAAKEAGVPLSVIDSAENVELVMKDFCAFVGDAVLVSTGALGKQAKLISRAARYSKMRELPNEFLDILDLAAETDSKFDLNNNNREFLLQYFGIAEGTDSLGKAKANMALYEALKKYGA